MERFGRTDLPYWLTGERHHLEFSELYQYSPTNLQNKTQISSRAAGRLPLEGLSAKQLVAYIDNGKEPSRLLCADRNTPINTPVKGPSVRAIMVLDQGSNGMRRHPIVPTAPAAQTNR